MFNPVIETDISCIRLSGQFKKQYLHFRSLFWSS